MVVPRAMVRDLAEGHDAAIMMSRLTLVMGVAPILAPSIGGVVLTFAHWRVIFWILALLWRGGCAMAWRLLPDTLPLERRTNCARQAVRALRRHPARPGFLSHAAMGGLSLLHVRLPGGVVAGVHPGLSISARGSSRRSSGCARSG